MVGLRPSPERVWQGRNVPDKAQHDLLRRPAPAVMSRLLGRVLASNDAGMRLQFSDDHRTMLSVLVRHLGRSRCAPAFVVA